MYCHPLQQSFCYKILGAGRYNLRYRGSWRGRGLPNKSMLPPSLPPRQRCGSSKRSRPCHVSDGKDSPQFPPQFGDGRRQPIDNKGRTYLRLSAGHAEWPSISGAWSPRYRPCAFLRLPLREPDSSFPCQTRTPYAAQTPPKMPVRLPESLRLIPFQYPSRVAWSVPFCSVLYCLAGSSVWRAGISLLSACQHPSPDGLLCLCCWAYGRVWRADS